jgi:hypothetical protein
MMRCGRRHPVPLKLLLFQCKHLLNSSAIVRILIIRRISLTIMNYTSRLHCQLAFSTGQFYVTHCNQVTRVKTMVLPTGTCSPGLEFLQIP